MEEFIHIKFENPKGGTVSRPGRIESAVIKYLSTILPKANPDFDKLIDNVEYWFLEYNRTEKAASREIGFDKNGHSIVAMPFGENYGYWTDNHLTIDDYEFFNITKINADDFENEWAEFEKKNKK